MQEVIGPYYVHVNVRRKFLFAMHPFVILIEANKITKGINKNGKPLSVIQ
jgi:hypothetical protein